MHLHSWIAPLARYDLAELRTPVTGARIIGGLVPCNAIAEEILTERCTPCPTLKLDPLRAARARGPVEPRPGVHAGEDPRPATDGLAPYVLYETLGPTLPEGAAS